MCWVEGVGSTMTTGEKVSSGYEGRVTSEYTGWLVDIWDKAGDWVVVLEISARSALKSPYPATEKRSVRQMRHKTSNKEDAAITLYPNW